MASVFQSPIGGVLYSIEVTSTYYIVNNMWRAAFCSVWSAIGTVWLRSTGLVESIEPTDFSYLGLSTELLGFAGLGLLCGLIGAAFIAVSSRFISLRVQNVYPLLYGRYRYTLLIATVCALASYQTHYTRLSDREVINDMMQSEFTRNGWNNYNRGFALALYFTMKFLATSICLSTHIPAGTLYPLLATGAVFGRLFEYVVGQAFTTSDGGIYAAVAAAALVAGTTQTISVAVIVFEATGQIQYFLPMIVAVLIAYSVSSSLSLSIYDAMIEIKGLPYLPSIKPGQLQSKNARDIMEYSFPQVFVNGTLSDLFSAIEEAGLDYSKFPVVDLESNLLYEVSVENAKEYFVRNCEENKQKLRVGGSDQAEMLKQRAGRGSKDSMIDYDPGTFTEAAEESEEVKVFLKIPVNFSDNLLAADDSPFTITETTPLAKVHFLFIMLGLHQVYVIRKGLLVGMITRDSFTKGRNAR